MPSVERAADIAASIAALDDATARLSAAVETTGAGRSDAFAIPSRLAGWTIGHVVTHLARNADAQRNLLHWAVSGEVTPMYPSPAARVEAIDAGATRDAADIAADFAAATALLREAIAEAPAAAWSAVVDTGRGGPTTADVVLAQRLGEVELHHHDLGVDAGLTLLDHAQASALLAAIVRSYARTRPVGDLVLQPVGAAPIVLGTGGAVIAGRAIELAGWLAGRTDGSGLDSRAPLPELPPW